MQENQRGILALTPALFPGALTLRVLSFTGKCSLFLRTIASPSRVQFSDEVSSKLQNAVASGTFLIMGSCDIKNNVFKSAYSEHGKEHQGFYTEWINK